ncbi:phenylacetate-CoA ligase [Chitinivorax tropicus]|uniref:Phenylacetate-CoA ligase n=1 Tax=Chitinivorax tropicus TaxID=714531 RepID=A0A840MJB2_9PROT|nr:hypothetical protein [Chitinivorax tropicus]MBB5017595.1 phenylacetate-CoA ligase [Chitinivorax tropicus]
MKTFASDQDKAARRAFLDSLCQTAPAELLKQSEMDAITAFNRALQTVPAYVKQLQQHGQPTTPIESIGQFVARAPLLNKHNTFGQYAIHDLCVDGNLEGVRSLLTSSGHSGVFSFGVNTATNLENSSKSIDAGLQYLFNIDELSTLVINALPMGVKVHTRATVLAETSVRDDMVFALVQRFAGEFDQIVMIGEGSFIKRIIEDGQERHGIDWSKLRVHLVTGEEGIAENYRTYIGQLMGIEQLDQPGGRLIMSSMGVAELDLNIFHETPHTITMRRLAHQDPSLRKALFGVDTPFCPMFFMYYPHRCYVETRDAGTSWPEVVISMLSPEMKLPLLRYCSGDYGNIFQHETVLSVLQQHGHTITPDLKLPFITVYGRGKALPTTTGPLYPEAVKEAIYADSTIAAALTGNFRLSAPNTSGRLDLQLRHGKQLSSKQLDNLHGHLLTYARAKPDIVTHPYATFPYCMEIDFERKFAYL